MQERLAARLADRMDLRVLECPGEPEPIAEALWWHRQYEDEPRTPGCAASSWRPAAACDRGLRNPL